MSRIGKKPIKIENNVKIQLLDGGLYNYKQVIVEGSKGKLIQDIQEGVTFEISDTEIVVSRINDEKKNKSYHGLYRSLLQNMIIGVSEGYTKDLEIVGVGYRASLKGNDLEINIGFTHPVQFKAPEGIKFEVNDSVFIKITGIDKQLVGETAAKIRSIRKPEPYKGKGIRYKGEQVRRKAGKSAGS